MTAATTSAAAPAERPIVVAANRLPVMRDSTTESGWSPSPGGLVRALLPMLRASGGTWVGWTGNPDDNAEPFTVDGVDLHPVPISAIEVELYYEGFSNDGLWPLYHDALRESRYDSVQWEAYQAVNDRFAVTLANIAPPNSIVWIHDYQLQLVPAMLRRLRPDVTIGFFLHIPFPPLELFSRLPWRSEIIEGLLGCDLIGFQRPTGATNFAACAHQLLDVTEQDGGINVGTHRVHLGDFPISIDYSEVEEMAAGRATRKQSSQIRARLGDPEVILLGVDRLDYTKGIGLRLRAFSALLESGRLDAERCVMVQVATPTREAVEHYQDERREIERLVGEINGRFSRIGLPVIHYLYQTLAYDDLIALYRAGDVMLVTPFRDGMNLVAKEYAAAHIDGDGVLVLSEFAGAADELTDAVLVNPHDDAALQSAIMQAVDMHRKERRERMAGLRRQVQRMDVQGWAGRFLTGLAATIDAGTVTFNTPTDLAEAISRSPRPLLVGLDVDGVLAPLVAHADDSTLLDGVDAALTRLCAVAGVVIAAVSGRSLDSLQSFNLPDAVTLVGSHGLETDGQPLEPLDAAELERLDALDHLARIAVTRAGDGAWIEYKIASLAVHIREADPEQGHRALEELAGAANEIDGASTKPGSAVLELFTRHASKGSAMMRLRSETAANVAVFVGDDVTDEEAFAVLAEEDFAIKVGDAPTIASSRLADPAAVLQWLEALADALEDSSTTG